MKNLMPPSVHGIRHQVSGAIRPWHRLLEAGCPGAIRTGVLSIFLACVVLVPFGPSHSALQPQTGLRGSSLAENNIFVPPGERKKDLEEHGTSIKEEQFLERYILYGTIKAGDYGVALIKVNPKKKKDVPKEIRDKRLIRLHPGESLEGYVLQSVGEDSALFDKDGEKVKIKTFDVDKKPERKPRVSVAQATPQLKPKLPAVPATLPGKTSARTSSPAKKQPLSGKKKKTLGKKASVKTSSKKAKKSKAAPTIKPRPIPSRPPSENPFLKALKESSSRKGGSSPSPAINPFLKFK